MKFEIKHLLGAATVLAIGLTINGRIRQIHVEIVSVAVAHLVCWWLAGLKLLNPRLLKTPASVISIAVSWVAVSIIPQSSLPLAEVSSIAAVVLACRFFLDPPQTQNNKFILCYCILVSIVSVLMSANISGDTAYFSTMWLMATVLVCLIHLKLISIRINRIGWLDKTANFLMWSGLIGMGMAFLAIAVCIISNYYTADLGNLFAGVIAYLFGVGCWIAISVGVASKLIADPKPPLLKIGSFHFVCIGSFLMQIAYLLFGLKQL